ncbi:MAG TPA: hypothetical protein VI542_16305 [Candidatus Tectomicrobia bacterium]
MATPFTVDDTENLGTGEEGRTVDVVPVGPITSTAAATLDGAFTLLCEALKARLEDDLPAQLHCDEIQGFYANGNHTIAWGHAILHLEQVLGAPLPR